MNLGPELNDKWLTLASEALLPPSEPSAVRPRKPPPAESSRWAISSTRRRRQPSEAEPASAAGAQSEDHALVGQGVVRTDTLGREKMSSGWWMGCMERHMNWVGDLVQIRVCGRSVLTNRVHARAAPGVRVAMPAASGMSTLEGAACRGSTPCTVGNRMIWPRTFLANMRDGIEVLFDRPLAEHLEEMLPQ
jgi:hypothetical protein